MKGGKEGRKGKGEARVESGKRGRVEEVDGKERNKGSERERSEREEGKGRERGREPIGREIGKGERRRQGRERAREGDNAHLVKQRHLVSCRPTKTKTKNEKKYNY